MSIATQREIPATPDPCLMPGGTFDPEMVLDVTRLSEFLSSRGIETSERQAMRLFAERKFPRFFIGKKQYCLAGKAWQYITGRRAGN